MSNEEKVVYMDDKETRGDEFKKQVEKYKDLAIEGAIAQLDDPRLFMLAGGVALLQGLRPGGGLGLGIKSGIATIGAAVGAGVVYNIVEDAIEKYKDS